MEEETKAESVAELPEKGKKKKFGPVKTSICIVSAAAVAALGVWAGIAFGRPQKRNDVDAGYGSVSYAVKEGEVFSPSSFVSAIKERDENGEPVSGDDGSYDAVDVFGRLNWTFAQQDNWSSVMHSTVQTAVGPQDVATYKRYADGILISSDITTSSMVNLAREFCYVGDRVMWRESEDKKENWDGINTSFPTDAPSGNMNISGDNGFKQLNGLPATELSVYVIEGNTVESAELSTASTVADGGLFTLTMHLLAKTDEEGKTGAAAYYGNQMVFTGGIDAPPDFSYITLSYTFTEDWQVVSCAVSEKYTASMKTIVSTCTSDSVTEYTYDVEGLEEEVGAVFESYYRQYAEQEATGPSQREITVADCLASAFGSVLTRPTTLNLALSVDDIPVDAKLYLDLGGLSIGGDLDLKAIEARLSVGSALNLYLKDGTAYVRYSNVRVSMSIDELTELLSAPQAASEEPAEEPDLLGELMGGAFTHDDKSARLTSTIRLMGIPLTLDFRFNLDSDRNASLARLDAACDLRLQTESVTVDSPIAAQVTFGKDAPAPLTEEEKAAYVNIAAYAQNLKDLFTSDVLRVNVDYSDDSLGLSVSGHADIDMKDLLIAGTFTVGYAEATKTIGVQYDGTAVYADIDGLKIMASPEDIAAIIGGFTTPAALSESEDEVAALPLGSILGLLLGEDFAKNFTSAAVGNALQLTIDATALLKPLLPDVALGDIVLTLEEDALSLSVYGVEASLTKGEPVTLSTDGYVGIAKYVETVIGLAEGGNITVGITYSAEKPDLSLVGKVVVGLADPVTASGELTLTVGETEHTLGVIYGAEEFGISIDGVKLKGSAEKLASILSLVIGGSEPSLPQSDSATIQDLLAKLFSVKLGELVPELSDQNGVLEGIVSAEKFLEAFQTDLKLGDIKVVVSEAEQTVALTIGNLALVLGTAEQPPVTDLTDYVSADGLADAVEAIVSAQGIALGGTFDISVGGTNVVAILENGGISWKSGVEARFDLVLAVNGIHHKVAVYVNEQQVKLAYGSVGAEIVFNDFGDIKAAFDGVVAKIQAIIDGVTGKTDAPALPEEAEAAVALAEGGDTLTAFAEELMALLGQLKENIPADGLDLGALLSKLTFTRPENGGVLLRIGFAGVTLDLKSGGSDGLGFEVGYENGKTTLSGGFTAIALSGSLAEMPDFTYLTKTEFVSAIGYLSAAVESLTAQDYTFTLTGSTTFQVAADPEPTPEPTPEVTPEAAELQTKTRYGVSASVRYHNGASVPVHLDVDNSNFYIETTLFLNVHLELVAGDGAAETDKSLYLDLFILDGAPQKDADGQLVTDGNLDIYLSLSQFASTDEKYKPLNIYAPADEIMTILSSAVAVLGFNLDFLDNYLVSKWLDLETVAQLETFTPFVSKLVNGLLSGLLPQPEPEEAVPAPAAEERVYKNYIKALTVSDTELKLVLNSADVYDAEGLSDLAVTFTKEGEKLSGIKFENVYDPTGTENTTLEGKFDYSAVTPDLPADPKNPENGQYAASYTSFLGAEKLILSLVKSATHVKNDEVISGEEMPHDYVLNENFYIEGSIDANLDLKIIKTDIKIDIIAISVTIDENGALGINARLEYKSVNVGGIVAINGDSEVDLTIKNGMVYIKRAQKTYYKEPTITDWDGSWGQYETPITLYRAMPMQNFMNDALGQLGFILNFNQAIMDEILKSTGSSAEPTPEEVVDYGARLSEVLKTYTYTPAGQDDAGNATAAKWDLTLNGDALAKGILGDMNIVIAEDTDGYIHDLSVDMTIVKVITAKLNLRWRNPGGIMEEGAEDLTKDHDIVTEIGNGMGAMLEKLNTVGEEGKNGWDDPATADIAEGPAFLEAKELPVSFKYHTYDGGTEDIGSQTVFVSTGADGQTAANTLLGTLTYPALLENTAEYQYAWESEQIGLGGVLPADGIIFAKQAKRVYKVTFVSDSDLGTGWEPTAEGKWMCTADMEYGAEIVVGNQRYTVTESATEFEINLEDVPEMNGRTGHWRQNPTITEKGVTFVAEYEGDTVKYKSVVAFTAEGTDGSVTEHSVTFGSSYTLVKPAAAEHTFLGWFMKDADGKWSKVETLELNESGKTTVEVEALWAKTEYGFTWSGQRNSSGGWSRTYSYTVSLQETQEELVGAFMNENVTRSIQREVYVGTKDTPDYTPLEGTEYSADMGNTGAGVKAYVKVTVTYTDGNGNVLYKIVAEKNGSYGLLNGVLS